MSNLEEYIGAIGSIDFMANYQLTLSPAGTVC
jgi:hypothetical protein